MQINGFKILMHMLAKSWKTVVRVCSWQLRQELCSLSFPFLSSRVRGWVPVWSSLPGLQGSVGSGCADTVSTPDMRAWSKLAHSAWPISTGLRIRETGSWERHRDNLGETKKDSEGYGEWKGHKNVEGDKGVIRHWQRTSWETHWRIKPVKWFKKQIHQYTDA